MRAPKHLLPFLFVSLIDLVARALNMESLMMVTKPLLMPALMLYFYLETKNSQVLLARFVVIALFFSFLGDVLIMFDSKQLFFLSGMLAFGLAHVTYIVINMNTPPTKFQLDKWDILFVVYGFVIFALIKNGLGEMYFPTLVYMVMITIMGMTARKRVGDGSTPGYNLVLQGAIGFMISDTIFAINRFVAPFAAANVLIIATYLISQFLIIQGLIQYIKKIQPVVGSSS